METGIETADLYRGAYLLCCGGRIGVIRLVRGQVLSLKESDFVRASRSMGASTAWIIKTHILRNSLLPTVTILGLNIGYLVGGIPFGVIIGLVALIAAANDPSRPPQAAPGPAASRRSPRSP